MKVQIYAHKTPEDAAMSVAAGVDFVGVSTGEKGRLKDEVNFAACREIFAAISRETGAMRVALTVAWELDEIIETIEAVKPDVIHLSGNIHDLPAAQVAELRQARPLVKIMQAIPVSGPEAIDLALAYQPVSDYFILDTDLSGFTGIGATGAVHDWRISAEIVRRVNIPVILAGGLKPDNVAEAIRLVKPWCVDSFTHTNIPGSKRKDPDKVKAFVAAAKSAL
jgi:phosphoribosylanthranilate isomerase